MDQNNSWIVIINPKAGKGKGQQDWPEIASHLERNQLNCIPFYTKYAGHAISEVDKFVREGFRQFIVVGGDGSLNETVNGIFIQKEVDPKEITLAHIPVGNGNDWGKNYKNPKSYIDSAALIQRQNGILQDIGRITYRDGNEVKNRYFINIAGLGFDAMVVRDVQEMKQKGKSGQLIYFSTLLKDLFRSDYIEAEIKTDSHLVKGRFLSIAAGMCRYNGGGMMILPFAGSKSGHFDITLIKDLSKMGVIANVLYLFNGTFVRNRKVELVRSKSIEINSEEPFLVEADGEFLGESPVKLEILPAALNVLVNSVNFEVNPKIQKYAP